MRAMISTGGYVKLYRSFLEWEWYDDEACVRLFIHLLMVANWRESRWHGQVLPAGSKIISQVEMAAALGWTRQKMGRTLDKLRLTGEVTTEAGSKWTLVTLVNWDKYQGQEEQTGQQAGTKRARSGQQPGTEEERKQLEGKKENTERAALVWPSWASDISRTAWDRWKAYKVERREGYKPIGEHSAFSKFVKEYTNDSDFVSAIEHSMANGWKGIFKPRNAPVLNINDGMTKEEADEEMRQIRIKHGRHPDNGWVGDEECSRALLIYMGRIKERKAS